MGYANCRDIYSTSFSPGLSCWGEKIEIFVVSEEDASKRRDNV